MARPDTKPHVLSHAPLGDCPLSTAYQPPPGGRALRRCSVVSGARWRISALPYGNACRSPLHNPRLDRDANSKTICGNATTAARCLARAAPVPKGAIASNLIDSKTNRLQAASARPCDAGTKKIQAWRTLVPTRTRACAGSESRRSRRSGVGRR